MGINYKRSDLPAGYYIITFEIKESDTNWLLVENLIKEKNGADFMGIVFTEEEILKADYSRMLVTYEQGYPYPESEWQNNRQKIYEDYCVECGVYKEQSGNFRTKNEFNTKNGFVSLMWSSAATFCSPEVINAFTENNFSGFTTKDIYIKNYNEKSKYKQLSVNNVTGNGMLNENIKFENCKKCGTNKFEFIKDNYLMYKRSALQDIDFQKTNEWFGTGWIAFQQIIISRKVAKVILENKWKGIKLEPLLLE